MGVGEPGPGQEYQVQKLLSCYLMLHYPNVEFRVDLAGSNLSKAQAGKPILPEALEIIEVV